MTITLLPTLFLSSLLLTGAIPQVQAQAQVGGSTLASAAENRWVTPLLADSTLPGTTVPLVFLQAHDARTGSLAGLQAIPYDSPNACWVLAKGIYLVEALYRGRRSFRYMLVR